MPVDDRSNPVSFTEILPMSQSQSSSSAVSADSTTDSQPQADADLALQNMVALLESGDFQTRWEAAKRLSSFGVAAIEPLLQLLTEDEDWELSWFIARILGDLQHPVAIQSLVQLVKTTENPEVANMAVMALANHEVRAINPLTELLHQPATRLLAVQALAQIHHTDVVVPLAQVVSDPAPEIRAAAIQALSHFHGVAVAEILLKALRDPAAIVRQTAVVAIGLQADVQNDLNLFEHLRPLLWDVNLSVCRQTATTLGRIGTTEAITLLAEVLQSSDAVEPLQIDAVRALGWIGTAAAIHQLQQFLERQILERQIQPAQHPLEDRGTLPNQLVITTSLTVNLEVISVLGRVETAEMKALATQILLALLDTNHPIAQTPQGKQTIALSLGQLGQPEAIDRLIELLTDPDQKLRLHTIAALKQLPSDLAYQRLVQLKHQATISEALREGITIALNEWHYSAETAA